MKNKPPSISPFRARLNKQMEVPLFTSISLLREKSYLAVFLGMVFLTTLLVYPYSTLDIGGNKLVAGSIADSSIKAKWTFLFEDQNLTQEKRKSVLKSLLPVFDFYPAEFTKEEDAIKAAFQKVHDTYFAQFPDYYSLANLDDETGLMASGTAKRNQADADAKKKEKLIQFESSPKHDQLISDFCKDLGLKLDERTLKTLEWHHYNKKIEEVILQVLDKVYEKGVVSSVESLEKDFPDGILVRNVTTGIEEKLLNLSSFYGEEDFIEEIMPLIDARIDEKHKGLKRALAVMLDKMVKPNIVFNKEETERRKEQAIADIKPIFISVQKGEMIIREGEVVEPYHVQKLNAMKGTEEEGKLLNNLFGFAFLSILLSFGLFSYIAKFQAAQKKNFQHVLLFCLLYLSSFALIRLFHLVGNGLYGAYGFLTPNFSSFIVPFAALFILMSIFFSKSSILIATFVTLAAGAFYFDFNPLLTLLILGSGFATFYRVHQFSEKLSIFKLGGLIGLVNVAFTLIYGIIYFKEPSVVFFESFAAFLGAMISAVIVYAVVPVIESLFHTTSDFKLLELSDFNHPLLREMVLKAPGTYHHSIMVGTLAEEAAKAIGANHLLARVGSYFHDIGKLAKPHYFIENIRGENKHDHLSPTMSALILQEHVKEGVEIAKKHKLIPVIQDFIREHHGTSLIYYFYKKASGQIDCDTLKSIKESFHYDGPTPRSKETAVVMMADSLEASARTLEKPNLQSITELVNKIVNGKKETGQLDHTPLTFNDLTLIKKSFINTLVNMLHSRIEYPDDDAKKGKREVHVRNISDNKKPERKKAVDKPRVSQEEGGKDSRLVAGKQ